MKWNNFLGGLLLAAACGLTACNENFADSSNDEGGQDFQYEEGTLILGKSLEAPGKGALAYIAPDGTVEENIWKKVNGTMLAGDVRDLYIHQGKLYVLCGNDGGDNADGGLVIANAKTFKKEKTFPLNSIPFEKPEGTGGAYKPFLKTPSNIAVLDEKNIFIKDAQGLFRFDSTTGKMTAVKGTYHIANAVNPDPSGELGGNLESRVTSRGLVVADGKLYISSAGFWKEITGVYEIAPNKDEVNRSLEIPLDLVSGLVKGEDNELLLASYRRKTRRDNEIHRIDLETFQVEGNAVEPTQISIAPGFFSKSGVAYADSYLYLSEIKEEETATVQKMTLDRISVSAGECVKLADFKEVAPEAEYLTTNLKVDVRTKYVYVSVTDDPSDSDTANDYILVYDCSGEEAVLKQQISKKTRLASGIYFMADYR